MLERMRKKLTNNTNTLTLVTVIKHAGIKKKYIIIARDKKTKTIRSKRDHVRSEQTKNHIK